MNNRIIEFDSVGLVEAEDKAQGLDNLTFRLGAGECLGVLTGKHDSDLPLFDLSQGLVEPDSGTVRFMGEEWSRMTARELSRARSLIGRVYRHNAWVSSQTVYDNILLSQRFHTDRPEEDMEKDVARFAQLFGLPARQMQRPDMLKVRDLKGYEWVRAMVGKPRLILVDQPETVLGGVDTELMIASLLEALKGGAAAVWITSDDAIIDKLNPACRCRMNKGKAFWENNHE